MGYREYLSGRYFIAELWLEIRTYKIFILVKTCENSSLEALFHL